MERRQLQQGHGEGSGAKALGRASAYKIYYVPGFLAGPVSAWPTHFERIRKLGFAQICLAPIGLPGRSGDMFLTSDIDQVDVASAGTRARHLLADVAKSAQTHGLASFVDIVLDRWPSTALWPRRILNSFIGPSALKFRSTCTG